MKQVGNTILAKGGNHILAKRDNSAWPKGSKLSGFSTHPISTVGGFATCIAYIAAYTADSFADRNRQGFALFLRRSGDNN